MSSQNFAVNDASPCVGVCQLDQNDRCLGCFRTVEEIANWMSLSSEQRMLINSSLSMRAIETSG